MDLRAGWYAQEELLPGKHRSSDEELDFFEAVSEGDTEAVRKNCAQHKFIQVEGVGRLSRDFLRNLKYHFIVTIAIMTRICIQKGMIEEEAYRLSDYYIMKMDLLQSVEAVEEIHDRAVLDCTRRMRIINTGMVKSKPVNDAINYIFVHRDDPLTVKEVAAAAGSTQSYLTRLFRSELDISVTSYIHQRKVEAAVNLLKYSDYSIVEIANRLGFSSQSRFIQIFRKELGLTPKKYRMKYGKPKWIVNGEKGKQQKTLPTGNDMIPLCRTLKYKCPTEGDISCPERER